MRLRLLLPLFVPLQLWCANTAVLFQPSAPAVGPFPTNALTVPTSLQKTGLQINLPLPASCASLAVTSDCVNIQLLNQLDGFSINPRITVCFSGPANITTLSDGISIVPTNGSGRSVGINQVIYDPAAQCAYAKPNHVLDQDTQYLLIVTSDVLDSGGKRVKADDDYTQCVKKPDSHYCEALAHAVRALRGGGEDSGIVAASLFTTLSATSWLQQARANVNSGVIPGAGALLAPMSTFALGNTTGITWMPQTGIAGLSYNRTLPLNVLAGVDAISFGAYLSPLYLNTSGPLAGSITTTPTEMRITAPGAVIPVSFHVFLPARKSATEKIPIIIYGHGLGDDQFGAATFAASTWAKKGFATLAIEITGHGFGPLSTTQVTTSSGSFNIPTPGRGIQFSPAAPIGPSDGCILPTALATRDCSRQTAVDLFALVRAIRETDGLGLHLDPSRIFYTGQSFGSFYGTLFEAVEPNVSAGTLNSGGATQAEVARLSPIARQLGAAYLNTFAPSLLNVPPAPSQAYFHDLFNDEYVYRGQAITSTVPGALPIQSAFEQADWLGMLGDPLSYAANLKTHPLPGVPAKPMLFQFALGDLEVPNPTASALVRAGGLQSSTWMLRTDLVAAIDPRLLGLTSPGVPYPIYPHRFLSNPTFFDPATPPLETLIGVAAQNQIADFFASGVIRNPNQYFPAPLAVVGLFQRPIILPERLNFFQIQP